jgi:hypothetical protein
MVRQLSTFVLAITLAVGTAYAQMAPSAAVSVEKGKGTATKTERMTLQGEVTAIDQATRTVTIRGGGGNEVTLVAGDKVKNFSQLKTGDIVTLTVARSLALELKKNGKALLERKEATLKSSAKPGEMPAGGEATTVTVTADVVAVDHKKGSVTLKGPQRTVEIFAEDKEMLKDVAVGDQVEATYTEAMVISARPKKHAAPAK